MKVSHIPYERYYVYPEKAEEIQFGSP